MPYPLMGTVRQSERNPECLDPAGDVMVIVLDEAATAELDVVDDVGGRTHVNGGNTFAAKGVHRLGHASPGRPVTQLIMDDLLFVPELGVDARNGAEAL